MNKLVFADVDGTILRHGTEDASPRVRRAIWQLLAEGNKLVPVTSRTSRMMAGLAMQLGLQDLGILDGGATVFDFATNTRDQALSRWLSPAKTQEIIEALHPHCDEIYYGEQSLRYKQRKTASEDSPSVFAIYPITASLAVSRLITAMPDVSHHINAYEGRASHRCVQIVRGGVSKYSGVKILLEDPRYSHVAPQNIVAIGDGAPDKDLMLAIPKDARRIAMSDAPELRGVTNTVVPPAGEDGFAQAMEKFVLG